MLSHEDIATQFMEGFWQSASHARSSVGNMQCFQEHTSSLLEENSNIQSDGAWLRGDLRLKTLCLTKWFMTPPPLLISTRWQIQEKLWWACIEAALRDPIDSHNILLMFASYVLILYTLLSNWQRQSST